MAKAIISEIELTPIRAKKGLTFFASCVLDNRYFVGNIAIFTKLDGSGFRCVYPTKRLPNGQQIPLFYPVDKQAGETIQKSISTEARRLLIPQDNQFELSTGKKKGGE
ncbi:hypothetical protein ACFLZP_02515 [Patescibacteria group bacterium]